MVTLVEETVGFPAYRPRSRTVNRPRAGQAGKVLECGLFGIGN
jgi:hypothetical protein